MKVENNQSCCTPPSDTFLAKVQPISVSLDPDYQAIEPKYETPFYDELSPNNSLIIPAVGESFYLNVESANRFHPGQWLEIEGVGRFPVATVINAKRLVLSNTGYNQSLDPGKSFMGQRKIWPVDRPAGSENETTIALLEAAMIDENFEFQAFLENANEAETGNPLAAIETTAACEPCKKNSATDDRVARIKFFKNIIFKLFTIALPLIPKIVGINKTFKRSGVEVTEPYNRLVVDPQTGDIYSKRAPGGHAIEAYHPESTKYIGVPGDFATKFYALSANKTTGEPQWRELAVSVPVYAGSPLVIGSVNFKSVIESATGISLPDTGTIQIELFATLEAINGHATFDGVTICRTGAADTYNSASRKFNLDLSSPTKTIAGTYIELAHVYLPAGWVLNN